MVYARGWSSGYVWQTLYTACMWGVGPGQLVREMALGSSIRASPLTAGFPAPFRGRKINTN